MKKVLIILSVISMFAIIGCTKSPEAHCAEAMDHTMKIMMDSPEIKKMPKDRIAKMKERFAKGKEKNIKKCVADYDKKAIECVLKASSMKEAAPCIKDARKKSRAKKKAMRKAKKAAKKVEVKAETKKVEVKKVEVKADAKKVEVKEEVKTK